ncbi:biotin--[acetyl-CoA-carboxylase] ligase [Arundinibacter roseus]|uniref:biotin--[acetyl-CoA-carboxylase] ligase n=1 Tax=Arundinibacter roseus TaxID=2070510 RepID=UPI001404A4EE|nr:biotin--[acetyl-CoA-carboxylase] ligase [Arundinibacter roseus]
MYDSCAKTLFIGKKIVYLPSCHSTNDIAAELVRAEKLPEGSVVITSEQTAGRGQRGSRWITEQGANFTFSVVFCPAFLAIDQQFLLSQAVALGVLGFLSDKCAHAQIKWPNDLYIQDSKVGGILIENSIQGARLSHAIAGIGLNINQRQFSVPRATSLFRETRQFFDLKTELPLLLQHLEQSYLQLRNGHFEVIRERYKTRLLGFGQKRTFAANGILFSGTVVGITPYGQLQVLTEEGAIREFDIKEIEWKFTLDES